MPDALSIALSGLTAQGLRLAASASNIANANTVGAIPSASAPVSTVYRPLGVSYAALNAGTGGVIASVVERPDGYVPVYDPSSVYANSEGLVAAPAVDLAQEAVNILESKLLFKANVAVIKTQKELMGDLLNILS